MPVSDQKHCDHPLMHTAPSLHAKEVGYNPRSQQQLFTASTGSRKRASPGEIEYLDTYPAPLILPNDELAYEPDYPPQSFTAWRNEEARNVLTTERSTVYVADYPQIEPKMAKTVTSWARPTRGFGAPTLPPPKFEDVATYLQAFFHDMPVKKLNDNLTYTSWEDRPAKARSRSRKASSSSTRSAYIGLTSSATKSTTRIRVRDCQCPQDTYISPSQYTYPRQLNLNDLLDHAISILPSDAYALLLLVDHDMYEDDDDDFCVGRAYGGSRIAVVSSARYLPEMDAAAGIDIRDGHWWPGSHCAEYVQSKCNDALGQQHKVKKRKIALEGSNKPEADSQSPLRRAITVHNASLQVDRTELRWDRSDIYTRRLCLTASHELLHCFGLDHCVYFACAMQGTSSLVEDSRQPPYLCPVCENKLAAAIVLRPPLNAKMSDEWWSMVEVKMWRDERRKALVEFCEGRGKDAVGFAALGTWYRTLMNREQS